MTEEQRKELVVELVKKFMTDKKMGNFFIMELLLAMLTILETKLVVQVAAKAADRAKEYTREYYGKDEEEATPEEVN